ncbi:MAG: GNAT family N-acetyltransferase [Vampirovibrionales bacterium]|nr:GNAT family N-acetyltransferase [Vampirovibrionales bacterium]
MKVVLLSPELADAYEGFLKEEPDALLYHSLRYRSFLEALLGASSEYWLVLDNEDQIAGVLPLMRASGSLGDVLNSLPYYGSNGGILASSVQAEDSLRQHYNQLILAETVAAATLIANPMKSAGQVEGLSHTVTDYRIGQLTSLKNQSIESLLGYFDGSTRRNIKKAERSGVTVSINNTAWSFLEECHQENMASIGGNAKSHQFFQLVPRYFRANHDYKLYVAEIEGKPVAGLLLFYYNQVIEYYTPVIRQDYRTEQPLAYLIFEAMKDGLQQGYHWWNWGGTWPTQEGVYRFKKKWGAQDLKYMYYVQINNPALYEQSPEELLREYPGFYLLPFEALKSTKEKVSL